MMYRVLPSFTVFFSREREFLFAFNLSGPSTFWFPLFFTEFLLFFPNFHR